MFVYIIVIISVLWVLITFFKGRQLTKIPQPKGIPIFGNIFDLDFKKPHLQINEWAKQHGDIYKLNLFGTEVLVITGYSQLYDVFVKKGPDFGGRPYSYMEDIQTDGYSEIVFSDMGSELKWRRKFVHSFLKQYSSGLKKLEEVAQSTSQELITDLIKLGDKTIDLNDMLSTTLINILCILIKGSPIPTSEAMKFRRTVNSLFSVMAVGGPGTLLNLFPWLRYFGHPAYKTIRSFKEERHKLIQPWIEDAHRQKSEGFINALVSLSEKEKEEHGINDTVIEDLAAMIVLAGSTTSLATLSFLMNILVHHPVVQRKLQAEILKVVSNRPITFMDKHNMPYHQAVLFEAARLASVSPLAVPHKTTRTTSIKGIVIPKDTAVWCNLWGLHHDETLWEDPFKFDPERFLDANGQLVPASHPNRLHLLPFGAGTRVCIGEVFAQSRMFLILAMIMQHFTILPETNIGDQPSCDPREMTMGTVLCPVPFKVVMKRRD